MKELLSLMRELLLAGEPLVLVTISESSGSTPRGAGARMLVGKGADGAGVRLWGSIGGGLSEHLAIEEAGKLLRTCGVEPDAIEPNANGELLRKYTLHPAEAADIGARCGGEISVSFRYIEAPDTGLLKEIEREAVSGGFVYVFGGGHIAQELVPLLAHLNFRCAVFDDREEFSKPDLFPGAEKVLLGDFKQIGNYVTLTEKDYTVIVTRGHQWDFEAWVFALESPAAYIGVIGSKTKHEFVKGQLRERGFDDAAISAPRVHAPIGLSIKSETPQEIAVSIAAELILVRASEAALR